MIVKPTILPILLFFIYGCQVKNQQKPITIKVNINEEYNSDLPELIIRSVVPMDSGDSALFGNISSIKYFSERYFLLDAYTSKSLIVFSRDGKFISKTKYGKGPYELINPYAFFVDRTNNTILLYDQALQHIFTFDLDLNFISKEAYEGVPILDFMKVKCSCALIFIKILYSQSTRQTIL